MYFLKKVQTYSKYKVYTWLKLAIFHTKKKSKPKIKHHEFFISFLN